MMLMKMLAKNAVPNPDISNPLTMEETSISTKALITKRKKPKEKTVSGSVRSIRRGLTMALQNPSKSADMASADAFSKRMPLKM